MSRTAAGDAFSSVAVQLMLLAARLELDGDRLANAAGQSAARWRVLAAVEDAPRTVASIARRLELKRQSVQRLADALVEDGLLAASDNPDDQRAALLSL